MKRIAALALAAVLVPAPLAPAPAAEALGPVPVEQAMAATAPQQVIYGHDRKLDAMLKKGEPYAP